MKKAPGSGNNTERNEHPRMVQLDAIGEVSERPIEQNPKGTLWVLESQRRILSMYVVYFLKSLQKTRYYIGVTQNVEKRLVKHNNGSTRSTRPYRPWHIIHTEEFEDKKEAYKREWFLKHPQGYLTKKKLIEQYG